MSYTLNKTGAQIDAILLRAEAGGAIDGAIALKAPLASPALTGTPTAPTAPAGTDTTQIATTEFVTDAVQTEAEADALRYAPAIVVPTSSAPVASFSDGADGVPIKSGTFQVEPAQDLHGQAYPWPAGGGKNKFDKSTTTDMYYIDVDGVIGSSTSFGLSDYIPVSGANVTISGNSNWGVAPAVCFFDSSKTYISGEHPTSNPYTLSVPNNAAYLRTSFSLSSKGTLQVELGTTATAYAPYSNICPISGWTGANICRTDGDNLLSGKTWTNGSYYNDSGVITSGGTTKRMNAYIPVTAGQPYMLSCANNPTVRIRVHEYDAAQNWLRQIYSDTGEVAKWTASSDAAYIRMSLGKDATDIICSLGTVYPISWQDEAGTVYGGTLEYKGGGAWRLTRTMTLVDLGTLSWTRDSSGAFYASVSGIKNGIRPMLCEVLNYYSGNFQLSQYASYADNIIGGNVNGGAFVYAKCTTYSTAATFQTAMSGKYLDYTLAAPTVYDLTGADVLTLLGDNNIWSDTGDAAVEYRADTKLYIDGQIASLQALVLENNG